jgi:hypothetical protein
MDSITSCLLFDLINDVIVMREDESFAGRSEKTRAWKVHRFLIR